nr:MAG TPA: minor structural protein [Caudoviricetes sp.]
MALTRKLLKELCLTDEQVDTIIEAHTETVEGLKGDIQKYKDDAEKLPNVLKELDELKKDGSGDYKAKYDKEHQDFQAYKDGIAKKEAAAAKEKAARAYFESKGIPAKSMGLVIRGAKGEIDGLELDGEKIKDASALDSLLDGDYKGLIGRSKKTGTETETPPDASGGAKSRADIYKKDDKGRYILSASERQKALAENMASESE